MLRSGLSATGAGSPTRLRGGPRLSDDAVALRLGGRRSNRQEQLGYPRLDWSSRVRRSRPRRRSHDSGGLTSISLPRPNGYGGGA